MASLLGFWSGQAAFSGFYFSIVWCYRSLLCWLLTLSCFCLQKYENTMIVHFRSSAWAANVLPSPSPWPSPSVPTRIVPNHTLCNQTDLNLNSFTVPWVSYCHFRVSFSALTRGADLMTVTSLFSGEKRKKQVKCLTFRLEKYNSLSHSFLLSLGKTAFSQRKS